jgi:GT2 family glycosyltransferase
MSVTVDVILPTLGNPELTMACFESISATTRHGEARVLWIDNGSDDEAHERAQAALDRTGLPSVGVDTLEPLGCVKAMNVGLALSTAPFVLLLNNDAELVPNWLEKLAGTLRAQPDIGAIGPCTNLGAPGEQRTATCRLVTKRPGMIPFFCALLRREVIVQCGYLSEEFAAGYGDDHDYCWRLQQAGWELAQRTDLGVVHHGRATYNAVAGAAGCEALRAAGLARFRRKWGLT